MQSEENWQIIINAIKSYRAHDTRGVKAVAAALGTSRVTVHQWVRLRKIPAEQVLEFEKILGVSRSIIRPDIYPPNDYTRMLNITFNDQTAELVVKSGK